MYWRANKTTNVAAAVVGREREIAGIIVVAEVVVVLLFLINPIGCFTPAHSRMLWLDFISMAEGSGGARQVKEPY